MWWQQRRIPQGTVWHIQDICECQSFIPKNFIPFWKGIKYDWLSFTDTKCHDLCLFVFFLSCLSSVYFLTSSVTLHQLHSLHLCYFPQPSSLTNDPPLYLNSSCHSVLVRSSVLFRLSSRVAVAATTSWFCFPSLVLFLVGFVSSWVLFFSV